MYVEKKCLVEQLQASQVHVLSHEIERMLQEEEEPVSAASTTDAQPLPAIRVLPLNDQLSSLEKTLTAYTIVLRRCIANLQKRIHNFRINDSCVPDLEQ